ncbi:class I SAM-dependent methyltransferase [Corynebacterium sanguinis]|uniref:Eco57I restriction-modification methylase domain-containing protein n=1 Tax=Corynebacterium sanguinis TaxID=2594913 RepID=UPI0011A394D8|nr:class I SAM-dependent methyltransferase [Corynebacterium sanguinis]TVS25847.1 class I SAM-dependent methyltransferase [Corynebacterium sanguinis]
MSTSFPGKTAPTAQKLRGGYYTPEPIARFIADWVCEAGVHTLEPSAGDGAILKFLAERSRPIGIEIDPDEAALARRNSNIDVLNSDFFDWFVPSQYSTFDGVAGNPPYIRFGNWPIKEREKALNFMSLSGLTPSRLTNAWLPFVVAAIQAVKEEGRIGLVLPAELLQVGYAKELRAFLEQSCSQINLVSFRQLVFPSVQQEVVLLLAEKGAREVEIHAFEVESLECLDEVVIERGSPTAPISPGSKWTQFYLTAAEIERLRALKNRKGIHSIGDFARVNVGVVTGRNSFFCLSEEEARSLKLEDLTIPLVSRSNFLRYPTITTEDLALENDKGKTRLLAVPSDFDLDKSTPLRRYIRHGEQEGVHSGYKCRIRTPWWSVPSTQVPDGFMLRQVSKTLMISANHADATSTDTVHRLFFHDSDLSPTQLAVAALNSLSFCSAEVEGRSYGGGVLELEPREAQKVLVPNPHAVSEALISRVDSLLRAGDHEGAVNLVNEELLVKQVGLSYDEVAALARSHKKLMNRRLRRGKTNRKNNNVGA